MKRFVCVSLVTAMVLASHPFLLAAPAWGTRAGQIKGSVVGSGSPQGVNARLRSLTTGQIIGTGTVDSFGEFGFNGLSAGQYLVELVDRQGLLVGTSAPVTLAGSGMSAMNVPVRPRTSGVGALAAAPGAAQSQTPAQPESQPQPQSQGTRKGAAAFFTSAAGIITLAAIGAGITTAIVVAQDDDASPSR